jgi:hypothetical protein
MSESKSDSKSVRLPNALADRVNGIKPMARRVTWVESCFDLVPLPPAEVDEAEVARAGVARPESLVEAPVAGVETKMKVALPEPFPNPSPGSIVEAGDGLGSGWIRRSLSLPIPLADALDNISDQRHAVEMLVAVTGDLSHADRVHAVLDAHSEVVQIARDLRQLHSLLGPSLPPRLAMHLRQAAHLWAGKLLRRLGEEPPAVALPVPALGTQQAPEGVPGHWEPVLLWMPVRLHNRVPDLQSTLTESLTESDAKWESLVGEFFANERKKVEAKS